MMRVGLTERQSDLLAFIRARLETSKVPPSFDEMRKHLGLGSKSGVVRLVEALVERGHLVRIRHRARALALPEQAASLMADRKLDPTDAVPYLAAAPSEPLTSIQRLERGLRVQLPPALSRRFLAYCTERGADPGREIGRALADHIAGGRP